MEKQSKFLLVSLIADLIVTSSSMLLTNYSVLPTIQLSSSSLSSPLLPSFLPTIVQTARADVDIDTSGNGKAVPLMVRIVYLQMAKAFAIL